ncbi:hypothetical protein SO694_00122049 [Aureococcus anophagefferens]|uniref:Uncharacterized protein n=1 Tax=Aureococcus anophagefferens TaxID=44056 RepID=A0ABR1G3K2_AURAN
MLTEELKDDASSLKDGASSLEDGAPPADDAADRGSEFFRGSFEDGASPAPRRRRLRPGAAAPPQGAAAAARDAAGNKVRGLHPGPSLTESGFERKIAAAFPPPQPLGDNGFTENQRAAHGAADRRHVPPAHDGHVDDQPRARRGAAAAVVAAAAAPAREALRPLRPGCALM